MNLFTYGWLDALCHHYEEWINNWRHTRTHNVIQNNLNAILRQWMTTMLFTDFLQILLLLRFFAFDLNRNNGHMLWAAHYTIWSPTYWWWMCFATVHNCWSLGAVNFSKFHQIYSINRPGSIEFNCFVSYTHTQIWPGNWCMNFMRCSPLLVVLLMTYVQLTWFDAVIMSLICKKLNQMMFCFCTSSNWIDRTGF